MESSAALLGTLLRYMAREAHRAHQAVCAADADHNALARECALAREHEVANISLVVTGLVQQAERHVPSSLSGVAYMGLKLKLARVPARFPELPPVPAPAYKTPGAAGMDLCADIPAAGLWLQPQEQVSIPTGFVLEIPTGYEGQVRPRSGLAFKSAVTVINSPGTLDSDYRGEVCVGLINHNPTRGVKIERGDRIAQLVIVPVVQPQLELVETPEALSATLRGSGGFGSTGTR